MRRALPVVLALGLLVPGARAEDIELEHWLEAAESAYQQGQFDSARALDRQILQMDPTNPRGLELERLLESSPGSVPTPTPAPAGGKRVPVPAEPAEPAGDPTAMPIDEAIQRLREDPLSAEAPALKARLGEHYLREARTAEESGNRGKALVGYRRAVMFKPDDPLIRYPYFQLLFKVQRLDEALEQAAAFLTMQPAGALAREMRRQVGEVHVRLAAVKMQANRWDRAAEHLEAALELGPEGGTALSVRDSLASCYFALGREASEGSRGESAKWYAKLVRLRPAQDVMQREFDSHWMDRLQKSALPVLWAEGKRAKTEGRLLEAYQLLGAVLVLANDPWMVKLATQYRKEIRDLAGDAVEADQSRTLMPGSAPVEEGKALGASRTASVLATGVTTGAALLPPGAGPVPAGGGSDLDSVLYGGAPPVALPTVPPKGAAAPPSEDDEFGAPTGETGSLPGPAPTPARPGTRPGP